MASYTTYMTDEDISIAHHVAQRLASRMQTSRTHVLLELARVDGTATHLADANSANTMSWFAYAAVNIPYTRKAWHSELAAIDESGF